MANHNVDVSPEGVAAHGVPEVEPGQAMSMEEAIALQLKELESFEEEQQPPPDQPEQPVEAPGQAVEEGPSSEDKPEEVSEPDAEEDVPDYLFEVDGQGIDLQEAKNGYMRHDKFTRTQQELAEQRKHYEEAIQQSIAEREQYIQSMQRAKALEEAIYSEPDWATLQQQNPDSYVAARQSWDQVVARREQFERDILEAQEAQQQELDAQLKSHYQAESEKLLEKVPEWREEKAAREFYEGVEGYLKGFDFTPEEIAGITDHRLLLILRDAIQGQAAKKAAPMAQKKVAKARKGLRGGTRQPMPNPDEARLAAMQDKFNSGNASIDDAIEMQMAELGLEYTDEMK